uniref:Integration host factor n=3 Tax=Gammaproteobacteria TaxID=1236 RepID=UPI0000F23D3B|nr:Chain A, Integration host factor [Escherichia coli]
MASTKSELIERLATQQSHIPAKTVEDAVKEMLEHMASTLAQGGSGGLTKAEMSEYLFDKLGLSKRDAKELVELFFEEIRRALENGEQVKLSGFGNFDLRDKNQRPGRNPKTGEDIPITARRVVTFRPGQKLKSRVENAGGGERIEIRGFGSFSLHYRAPRTGRNPKTGDKVELEGKYVPHFKPGKELRDRANIYGGSGHHHHHH